MWIIAVIIAGLALWAALIYNRLVRDRNRVDAAWSDIDVQLKRRHDLIPKLVDAVKAYAGYERATLENITRLRAEAGSVERPGDRAALESTLSRDLVRLIAVAEQYPDLKSSAQFLNLQKELSNVENDIQYSRRYYNGAVRNLNVRIESFPNMLVARPLGFRLREFFELETATEAAPPELHLDKDT